MDQWLASLKPDVETLVAEPDGDVEFFPSLGEERSFPGFFLKRTTWPGTGLDATILISLQWSRGKTLLGEGSGLARRDRQSAGKSFRLSFPLR